MIQEENNIIIGHNNEAQMKAAQDTFQNSDHNAGEGKVFT